MTKWPAGQPFLRHKSSIPREHEKGKLDWAVRIRKHYVSYRRIQRENKGSVETSDEISELRGFGMTGDKVSKRR